MANMASFEYDSPFTPSRPRKKRKNRDTQGRPNPMEALERTRPDLLVGNWMQQCTKLLRDAMEVLSIQSTPKVLCLGLGSPTASREARAQLAFLLEVCDDLIIEHSNVSVYDPAFTDEDDQLLATLAMNRLPDSENRNAAYPLPEPTIVYMPHCDLHLYENLLGANWSRDRLPQLILIANRFSEYTNSIPSHRLNAEHPLVARTAFNNLSIQFLRPSALASVDWSWPPSPPTSP